MHSKKKTIVIEACCLNSEHSLFNSGLIKELSKQSLVKLIATSKHIDAVKNKLGDLYFESRAVDSFPRNSFFSCLFGLISLLKQDNDTSYIFSSVNTFHVSALTIINFFLKRDIIIIPHAILENSQKKTRFLDKLFFFRRFHFWFWLYQKSSLNKFILLSDSISYQYDKHKDLGTKYFILEHPYIYEDSFVLKTSPTGPIKIALVGICNPDKGADWLVRELNKVNSNGFEFYFLGADKVGIPSEKITKPFDGFVPQAEYESILKSMDYFIFPFPEGSYKLRASGSLFDAISLRKPIITSKNDFITKLLDKHQVKYIPFERKEGLAVLLDTIKHITDEAYIDFQVTLDSFVRSQL